MARPHENSMEKAVDQTKHKDGVDNTNKLSDANISAAANAAYTKDGHDTLKQIAGASVDSNTEYWGKHASGDSYLHVNAEDIYKGSGAKIVGESTSKANGALDTAKSAIHDALSDATNQPKARDDAYMALNQAENNTKAAHDATGYKLAAGAQEKSPMSLLLPGGDNTDKTSAGSEKNDPSETPGHLEGVLNAHGDPAVATADDTSTDIEGTAAQHNQHFNESDHSSAGDLAAAIDNRTRRNAQVVYESREEDA